MNNTFTFGGHTFDFVGILQPELENGKIFIENSSSKFENINNLPYNKYGEGYFCRFELPNSQEKPGVFLWVADNRVLYLGYSNNMRSCFKFYGKIAPSSCWIPGPSTDCKLNKVALQAFLNNKEIKIYFKETKDYKKIKSEILQKEKTIYNEKYL